MQVFAQFTPDQPAFGGGTTLVSNVLPRTAQSYAPFPELQPVTDALTTRPYGAGSFRGYDGNVDTFVADETDIFILNGTTWDNVSKSAGAYSVATDDYVDFVAYGNRVISCNGPDSELQTFLLGTDVKFSDLATGAAPKARHAAVINNFVMVGNTVDSTDGAVGNRVRWCAIDDPTDWPVVGSADAAQKQSDLQNLPNGGWVQNIIGAVGGADGAIFMEHSIYRVTYEGSPAVFNFYEVEKGRGTPAPRSVVNVGPFAFYLGEDGFYMFNGSQSTPIGAQRVDKYFFADLDQNYFHRIVASIDPINKHVLWSYPAEGNTGGRPNKIIAYNWDVDRWSVGYVENDLIFQDLTTGYTLEQLDAFGDLDTLEFSLDSRIWTGGRLVLSGFDANKKLGRFGGANLAAIIETQEVSADQLLSLPNNRIYINGIRPIVDGGTVTVAIKYRDTPSGTLATDGPNVVDADGAAHFTRSTRYVRAQINIAAGGTWTHAQGVTLDITDDGVV